MPPDRLVRMANQIGTFFASQAPGTAVPSILGHIEKFWEPRMRRAILAHLAAGGEGLDPPVREALVLLRRGEEGDAPVDDAPSGHGAGSGG